MIDGREYWISGWIKKNDKGEPWLSLSFKAKDQKQAQRNGVARTQSDQDDGADDGWSDQTIPF